MCYTGASRPSRHFAVAVVSVAAGARKHRPRLVCPALPLLRLLASSLTAKKNLFVECFPEVKLVS